MRILTLYTAKGGAEESEGKKGLVLKMLQLLTIDHPASAVHGGGSGGFLPFALS